MIFTKFRAPHGLLVSGPMPKLRFWTHRVPFFFWRKSSDRKVNTMTHGQTSSLLIKVKEETFFTSSGDGFQTTPPKNTRGGGGLFMMACVACTWHVCRPGMTPATSLTNCVTSSSCTCVVSGIMIHRQAPAM